MKTIILCTMVLISFIGASQDVIIFRNGAQQNAKVLEVGTNSVLYKKSENIEGPNYVVNSSEVSMIVYANGARDVMANSNNIPLSPQNYPSYSTPTPSITYVRPQVNVVVAPSACFGPRAWGGYNRPWVGVNYQGGYSHPRHHHRW